MSTRPPGSRVKHGEPSCADYGCKRVECLEARRYKQKRNKLLRETGRPGMVSPERAAAHIAKFRAASVPDKDTMALMELSRNTFYRVMRGMPLSRGVEQRILSVPAPAPTGRVDTLVKMLAVGVHRRLQALLRQGWPLGELERRLGVHVGWIGRSVRQRRYVTMAVQTRVLALYDGLWNVAPETAGVTLEMAQLTRRIAAQAGYAGPLAWDDDTIDDPAAIPVTDALAPAWSEGGNLAARWLMGESVLLEREDRREVLQHLYEWTNDTTAEIAAQLEMTPAAAERQWERMKERAAAEGRRLWRRVYVPRERDLTQNEMEEAA